MPVDQPTPFSWHSLANSPAQTSSAVWPPSSMTDWTLSMVIDSGVSRIDGTSRPPSASSTVPVVSASPPVARAIAASASAPASWVADL